MAPTLSTLGRTGYRLSYRADDVNRCPGCGGSNWLVGRITAECAFCGSALPIAAPLKGFRITQSVCAA